MEENLPEFGIKRDNEERRDGGLGVIYDPETQRFAVGRHPSGLLCFFGGGVDDGEDLEQGILREVREESGLSDFLHVEKLAACMAHYYNMSRKVNRVTKTTALLIILKSRKTEEVFLEEHENFVLDWATKDELLANWIPLNGDSGNDHWQYFLDKAVTIIKELGYPVR